MNLEIVTVILSIGALMMPIVFGGVLWKISKEFVTKDAFIAYQAVSDQQRTEMKIRLGEIERNTSEIRISLATLVERTVHER